MGCCNDEKPKGESIPNRSGELRIVNEDSSVTTIPLNERELWLVKTSLKETLRLGLNEPGYVNGEVKAVLIGLVEKIEQKKAESCGEGGCGCEH